MTAGLLVSRDEDLNTRLFVSTSTVQFNGENTNITDLSWSQMRYQLKKFGRRNSVIHIICLFCLGSLLSFTCLVCFSSLSSLVSSRNVRNLKPSCWFENLPSYTKCYGFFMLCVWKFQKISITLWYDNKSQEREPWWQVSKCRTAEEMIWGEEKDINKGHWSRRQLVTLLMGPTDIIRLVF